MAEIPQNSASWDLVQCQSRQFFTTQFPEEHCLNTPDLSPFLLHLLLPYCFPLCKPAYHLRPHFGLGFKFNVEGFALAGCYCGGTGPAVAGQVHLSNPQVHLASPFGSHTQLSPPTYILSGIKAMFYSLFTLQFNCFRTWEGKMVLFILCLNISTPKLLELLHSEGNHQIIGLSFLISQVSL